MFLEDSVVIASGCTLTVNEWARVLADADTADPAKLVVKGQLELEGDRSRSRFLSDGSSAGDWYGILVDSGGSVNSGDGCLISDAVIGVTVG